MPPGTRIKPASSGTKARRAPAGRSSAARRRSIAAAAAKRISRLCSASSTSIPVSDCRPLRSQRAVFRTVLENALIEAPLPHLGDAVQQRQLVLDLSRCAIRSTARRLPPLHRPDARHSALFRRADRQHARRARARLHACRERRLPAAMPRSPPSPIANDARTRSTQRSRTCRRPSPPPSSRRCAMKASRRSSSRSSRRIEKLLGFYPR